MGWWENIKNISVNISVLFPEFKWSIAGNNEMSHKYNGLVGEWDGGKNLKNIDISILFAEFKCSIGGNSMMSRKDSDLITFWNVGFKRGWDGGKN